MDVIYHYKSLVRSSPVVHLVGPQYFLRAAHGPGQGAVKAYSNAAILTLSINGKQAGSLSNNEYKHLNRMRMKNVFYWPNALVAGKNVVSVDDGAGHSDTMTVYYLGTGTTLPLDAGAKVSNLTASNGHAYFIDTPIAAQRPIYFDFDGTGDNTLDLVPAAANGASWIATKRQSDATKRTDLAFDLLNGADVFIMFTKQSSIPAWITRSGFADTGTAGQWRDNTLKLVDFSLYKRTFAAGSHVTLATSAIDYVVLVK
jgi:hypothetical protein